jgi:hypothetical protein
MMRRNKISIIGQKGRKTFLVQMSHKKEKRNKKEKGWKFYPIKIIIKICDQEKRVSGDLFSLSSFSLTSLFESSLSHVLCRKALTRTVSLTY